jgi:hydroxymethylglutaryl-CoA lyase
MQQVRGYVSCVLGCPYQGHVEPAEVAKVANILKNMGRS